VSLFFLPILKNAALAKIAPANGEFLTASDRELAL
jgi:hypothetical protein